MGKLIAAERHKEIIRLLNSNGSVKISQLAKQFQVSRETIRRDLLHLNEIGAVKKVTAAQLLSMNCSRFHGNPG
ncbi:DeoR protein [Anaerostipes caccae]|uniref:DeoR family transcriptional regulator n=1 Tax=Anaerostipes caccae TaxID=105841 RepID=UPI0001F013C2|nr:DeoR family transcriptional regulator [Anaerostipes caccae]EFV22432.1 DeoR protein [Anaerostipes caccae]